MESFDNFFFLLRSHSKAEELKVAFSNWEFMHMACIFSFIIKNATLLYVTQNSVCHKLLSFVHF